MKKYLFLLTCLAVLFACNPTITKEAKNSSSHSGHDHRDHSGHDHSGHNHNHNDHSSLNNEALRKMTVGSWNTVWLKVDFDSHNNEAGKDSVFQVGIEDFPRVLQIGGNKGTYNEDGSYFGQYLSVAGKPIFSTKGTWTVEGDSIIINQKDPIVSTQKYRVRIKNDTLYSTGLVDFDSDGKLDDAIEGKAHRVDN